MLPAAGAVLRRLAQAQDHLANSTGWLVDHTYASLVRSLPLLWLAHLRR